MDLKKLVEGTLDDLDKKGLKSFKWHLKNLKEDVDGFPNIANNNLPECADSQDTVDKMVERYESPEEACKVAVFVLRKMENRLLAKKVEDRALQSPGAVPVQDQDQDGCMSGLRGKMKTPAEKEKEGCYSMASNCRGVCVIINNVDFGNEEKNRKGSDVDAAALAEVFKWLKFRVVMCKDKTAENIHRVLKVFSELKQLSDLQPYDVKEWVGGQFTDLKDLPKHGDAFVCCILSHGKKEGVCGTDGMVVPINKISEPFNGEKCMILVGKPKLFFIQACRGCSRQKGVPVPKKNHVEDRDLQADDYQDQNYTLPIHSDFLVFMANVEQYVSIRSKTDGSWFIQSLCRQLKDGCLRGDDIHAIITLVNAEVCQKECELPVKDEHGNVIRNEQVKQSPDSSHTLTKTLIFPAP
ncbi:caspase-8-like [Coregonus clupeaformis]|uniref:caspase-8-like n=1 Tax=Coregonus clupeaformis TaxID=59861 RepID=UPI001E1C6DC6|nr:caspase-8-like [Coregonus clupeaformis]